MLPGLSTIPVYKILSPSSHSSPLPPSFFIYYLISSHHHLFYPCLQKNLPSILLPFPMHTFHPRYFPRYQFLTPSPTITEYTFSFFRSSLSHILCLFPLPPYFNLSLSIYTIHLSQPYHTSDILYYYKLTLLSFITFLSPWQVYTLAPINLILSPIFIHHILFIAFQYPPKLLLLLYRKHII